MHIVREGSIVATAQTLEDAQYAVRVIALEDAEADLAKLYRSGGHPHKGFLEQRRLYHLAEYDVTGPHA
jgi:hypothetical protein